MFAAASRARRAAAWPSTTLVLLPFCSTPGMISLVAASEMVTVVERNSVPVVVSKIFTVACRSIVRRSAFDVPNWLRSSVRSEMSWKFPIVTVATYRAPASWKARAACGSITLTLPLCVRSCSFITLGMSLRATRSNRRVAWIASRSCGSAPCSTCMRALSVPSDFACACTAGVAAMARMARRGFSAGVWAQSAPEAASGARTASRTRCMRIRCMRAY